MKLVIRNYRINEMKAPKFIHIIEGEQINETQVKDKICNKPTEDAISL